MTVETRESWAERQMAGLTDAERQAVVRGEAMPTSRPRYSRLVRGVSAEAAGLFLLLERANGKRSVESLVGTNIGVYVSAATRELAELGLAERVGDEVRLLPAADGVAVISSWSMAG